MEWVEFILRLTWAILPVVIGFAIIQYRKMNGNMDMLNIIIEKAESLINWVEVELPGASYIEKVRVVVEVIKDELADMGFRNIEAKTLSIEKEVVSAFRMRELHLMAMAGQLKIEGIDETETIDNVDL